MARELVYTVVGGRRADRVLTPPRRSAVLVLNRGPRHTRSDALQDAVGLDAGEVISVERAGADVDTLSRENPEVRFLLVADALSVGELINIGIAEAHSRNVLVVWSDVRLEVSGLAKVLDTMGGEGPVCCSPALAGPDGGAVPVCAQPTLRGTRFSVLHTHPDRDSAPTLYPFDYMGVYRSDRFLGLGGYEPRIGTPYWQKLDLGLRAHLFGACVRVYRELRGVYRGPMPTEDTTPDPAYRGFYLRNVAVRHKRGEAYLPVARYLPFLLRSGTGPVAAAAEFRDARRWVRLHRQSYRRELGELVHTWGSER